MLIPWSVEMKSKDVWLWEPAQRWRKRKQNNRPTKGWAKITQMADLRITKTEHTERKDNRNEPSLHTWCGSLCNTSQHTQRPLTHEPFISHTDITGSGIETGSNARSGDGRQAWPVWGQAIPKSLLSRNWAARSYYRWLNLWFQLMTGTMGSDVGSNTWMINKVLIQTSQVCVERQERKKKNSTKRCPHVWRDSADYATISLRLKMFRYFQSPLCSPLVLGTVCWWGILHIKKKKTKTSNVYNNFQD